MRMVWREYVSLLLLVTETIGRDAVDGVVCSKKARRPCRKAQLREVHRNSAEFRRFS